MSKQWYVVQAYSNFEKQAMESLKERVKGSNFSDQFGDIVVPTEQVVEMRAGQKRRSERKFYPGYVLIEMELDENTWQLVKETPRIITFVSGIDKSKPIPLTETEVVKMLERMEVGKEKAVPKNLYEAGEEIRVIDGPFNDFSGTVEEVNYEKSRLRVAVTIFGRPTPVDLAFEQVEKL